jgi:hypothetical protein
MASLVVKADRMTVPETVAFRIGVLQPGVQQRKGALDAEGDKDQVAGERADADLVEGDRAGGAELRHDPCDQQHP